MDKIINNKNIIFDLGGVLLNIEPQKTLNAFVKIGLSNDYVNNSDLHHDLFNKFEKGELSAYEFRARIKKEIKADISDKEIDHAWNSMLLDFPLARLKMLQELKKTHKIYLLSNTNSIHLKHFTSMLASTYGIKLENCFHQVFFSHELGCRKPDKQIFQHVLDKLDIVAQETIFIDDIEQNAIAASQVGFNYYYLDLSKGNNILDLLNK